MSAIRSCELPAGSLLARYGGPGGYADCYVADVAKIVSHAEFVEAFYTTWLFKVERFILAHAISRPSTDAQAMQLAQGQLDAFAAWSVEGRATDQMLLRDFAGRTRSWLMVAPGARAAGQTRLYFGSAVVRSRSSRGTKEGLGSVFAALLGLHRIYSRLLLGAARARLLR
jgi:hypothetical protein